MKISWATDELFQIPDDIFGQEDNEGNLALHAKYQEYYDPEQLQEKYVLRGSILTCNRGSASSRLDMPSDHGIDPAIALTSDCVINANIHTFGTCSCRADMDDSQCRPNLNNAWLQGENATVKIWNEITQKYEATVKESALLPCFIGGMISIAEVFQRESAEVPQLLLCMHGKKFALVDTLHPMAGTVLKESTVLVDIEDMGVPKSISSNMTFSMHGGYSLTSTADGQSRMEGIANKAGEVKDRTGTAIGVGVERGKEVGGVIGKINEEEDSAKRQQIGWEYAFDEIDETRTKISLPEGNSLTQLAQTYLEAGGDLAGANIGLVWMLGIAPDASKEVVESLKQKKVNVEEGKIGDITIDTTDWLGYLLIGYVNDGMIIEVKWKDYMQENPILKGKVGDVVIPMGTSLEKGKSREIKNMRIPMIIENGGGYTGYEFLHGTDMNVGGFQIDGEVSKNNKGDVTYNLTYIWNDIINAEVERYHDDAERNEEANKHFNPKDYIIRIKWKDKTVIKAKTGTFTSHSGWLKDWSSDWVKNLSKAYSDRYDGSENEQIVRFATLSWPERLEQIKEEYKDYYN